jgi:HD-GYP domain-containing protein (c-di-GMP phosphodiesterase class II)
MDDVAEWVLHLHERYDGAGYPFGLAGDQIPLQSRILHVADALEAMTSSRVYRTALPLDAALGELENGLGTQFDPDCGRLLIELVKNGELTIGDDLPVARLAA